MLGRQIAILVAKQVVELHMHRIQAGICFPFKVAILQFLQASALLAV
jgi:hypothetical protein